MFDDTLFWSKARVSSCAQLAVAATISVMLASCVEPGPTTSAGTGALSGSGDSSLRTYAPDEWTTRCAAHLGTTRLCRALSSARGANDRERAALDLNVASATGLAAQHFVHGTRIAISIADLQTLARAASAPPTVATAVFDANRAYAGGIDHAVLADWVTTPVCGLPASFAVQGPASSRCVALDGDCRRGSFDAAHGCCDEWLLPAGMVCGEDDANSRESDDDDHDDHGDHHGDRGRDDREHGDHDDHHGDRGRDDRGHDEPRMCSGRGECLPASQVPATGRALGAASWIEPVRLDQTPPAPSIWYVEPESGTSSIEIRLDGEPAAIVPAGQRGHRTRVGMSLPGTLGVTTLDLGSRVSDTVARSLYLPRRISLNTDLANGETYEVCATGGAFDDLPTLVGECEGDQIVTCPSAPGAAITCTVDPRGYSVVRGPGLSVAWERDPPVCGDPNDPKCFCPFPNLPNCGLSGGDGGMDAGPEPLDGGTDASLPRFTDIRDPVIVGLVILIRPITPLICHTPACLFPRAIGFHLPGPARCGSPPACTSSCGNPGVPLCVNGHWGPCIPTLIETCNGIDDDCDTAIDEYTDSQCDDGLACTEDLCRATSGGGAHCDHFTGPAGAGGSNVGPSHLDFVSASAVCTRTTAPCETARCAPADPLAPFSPPRPLVRDPRDSTDPADGSLDENGCIFIERDQSYCVDIAGGLCAFASERCAPSSPGAEAATGCLDFCHPFPMSISAIATAESGAQEVGATFVPGGTSTTPSWVVQYNDQSPGANGWAWSTDGRGPWSPCNADSAGCGVSSGFGAPFVPPAPSQFVFPPAVGATTGLPFWAGDPGVSAAPDGSVVATVNMSSSASGVQPDLIVVSLSFDRGRTFTQSALVNDTGCTGTIDQPWLAFDPNLVAPFVAGPDGRITLGTPVPSFFVAFRWHEGLCVRQGFVDPATHALSWSYPAGSLDHLHVQLGRTIGGVVIQSLNGIGQLMYSDTSVSGRRGGGGLFCTPGDREDTSFWVADIPRDPNVFAPYIDSNVKVAESHLRCTLDGTANGLTTGIRDFGFALSSGGVAFAAVPTDHETVQVFRRYGFGGDWLEDTDVVSPYGSGSAVFWPTLATAGDAVGLTFGTSVGSDLTRIDVAVTGIIDSSIQTSGATGPLGVFDRAYLLSPGGHVAFGFGNDGDYMGLAAGSGETFVAAWPGRSGTTRLIQTNRIVMRHGVR